MEPGHVAAVVGIHRLVLPTFTAGIPGLLERLYESLLSDSSSACRVLSRAAQSEVSGFLTATADYARTLRHVEESVPLALRLETACHIFSSPKRLSEWFSHWRLERHVQASFQKPYPTILTFGLAPEIQGRGLGKLFITASDDFFRSQGFYFYYVDTLRTNAQAKAFYEKNGFKPHSEFLRHAIYSKDLR